MNDIEIQDNQTPKTSSKNTRHSAHQAPPQKGFILERTYTVARYYKATLWTWVGFVTLLVTLIFHIIAFAAPGWVYVKDFRGVNRDVGLWMTCVSTAGCFYHTVSELSDGVKATQAFAVFSLLAIFVSVAFITAYIFFVKTYQDPRFAMGALISRGCTALFLLLSISIYGARWADGKYDSVGYQGNLGYCFGFEVVCFICELTGAILVGGEIMTIMKRVHQEY